jgi:hypothetical protein
MKQLLKISFLGIFSVCLLNADLGILTIQAICKISLENGKEVQGFILVSRGGYGQKYHPNGFCFVHDNGNYQLLLFNLDYAIFTPNNYGSHRGGTSQLKYAQSTTFPKYPEVSIAVKEVENEDILERKILEIERFRLQSYITVFKELPLSLHLIASDANLEDAMKIAVEDIESFELMKEPSEFWRDDIKSRREALQKKMIEDEKAGKEWVDYMEPAWYHEIVKDEKQHNEIRRYFRLN